MASSFVVVYVTTPPGLEAKKLTQALLKARSAACVNMIPLVRSSYWWKKKIETARESLLVIKTRRSVLPKLMALVRKHHPYTIPEIIALPVLRGHKPYLNWVASETK